MLIANEAMDDIYELVRYIHIDLSNPDTTEKLHHNLNREVKNIGVFLLKFLDLGIKYWGYIIHKKVYDSYRVFYIINSEKQEVYVLRVIKDLMNWRKILNRAKIYHFSSYSK